MRRRLYELVFCSDTQYTELLLGVLSFVLGWRMLSPLVTEAIVPWHGVPEVAHFMGGLLVLCGAMKIYAVWTQNGLFRKAAFLVSCSIWLFLAITYGGRIEQMCYPLRLPLCSSMAIFDLAIYCKLRGLTPK